MKIDDEEAAGTEQPSETPGHHRQLETTTTMGHSSTHPHHIAHVQTLGGEISIETEELDDDDRRAINKHEVSPSIGSTSYCCILLGPCTCDLVQ